MNAVVGVARRTLASMRLALTLLLAATLAHAAPENGWWWNPDQGGSGFFLEAQGGQAFVGGYLYAADGRATWLASNGPMPDANSYDGRLLSFANGQTLVGDYLAPAASDAGPVSLRFSDSRHGTLTWAGVTVPIQRYSYMHGAAASFQPETGWWWNPEESGRGFSIELQGDRMFLAGFMYDASGNPVWYAADALMESPQLFRGTLMQYAGGQSLAGPYRAPSGSFNAGTVTVQFSATDLATVTLTDDGAVAAKGAVAAQRVKMFTVQPLMKRPPRPAPPPPSTQPKVASEWVGIFDEKLVITDGTAVSTRFARATFMTWTLADVDLAPLTMENTYKLTTGIITLTYTLEDPRNPCTVAGSAAFDFTGGDLVVNANRRYRATIPERTYVLPVLFTCPTPDGVFQVTQPIETRYQVDFRGTLDASGRMTGEFPPLAIPFQTYSGFWDFAPR